LLIRGLNWLIFRARPWFKTVLVPSVTLWLWRLLWTYAVLLLVLALVLISSQLCRHGFADYPPDPGPG
jgi:hypothetical protein